jgi:hypothetical protein
MQEEGNASKNDEPAVEYLTGATMERDGILNPCPANVENRVS